MTTLIRITEEQLLDAVIELAQWCQWKVHHCRPAIGKGGQWSTPIQGSAGFPDLVLVRGGHVIFAELKTDTGKVTDAQRAWLDELLEVPSDHVFGSSRVTAVVWRPADYRAGVIEEALR